LRSADGLSIEVRSLQAQKITNIERVKLDIIVANVGPILVIAPELLLAPVEFRRNVGLSKAAKSRLIGNSASLLHVGTTGWAACTYDCPLQVRVPGDSLVPPDCRPSHTR
jgi:hypothetical protein